MPRRTRSGVRSQNVHLLFLGFTFVLPAQRLDVGSGPQSEKVGVRFPHFLGPVGIVLFEKFILKPFYFVCKMLNSE